MKGLLKRLFCKHEEKFCVTNIHGDMINHLNCRAIWECKKCGKWFKSNELCKDCNYVNFRIKESNNHKEKQFYYKLGVMCGETLFTTFKYDNFKDLINSMKSILRKYGWDMYLCTFVVQAFKDNSYDFEKSCFMQEEIDIGGLKEETLEQDLLQMIDRNYKENNND